jgi:hypothetical protein
MPCLDASIHAADPTLDLAVLFVGGASNLPFVALGDSDTVFSGHPVPKQLEQALLDGRTFERMAMDASASQARTSGRLLSGRVSGTSLGTGAELAMRSAILDLRNEKLVARVIGPAASIAFNECVLRDSLATLDGVRLEGTESRPETLQWTALSTSGEPRLAPLPAGWPIEPSPPAPCQGLPPPSAAAARAHRESSACRSPWPSTL